MCNGSNMAIKSLEIDRAAAASAFIDKLKRNKKISDKDRAEICKEIENKKFSDKDRQEIRKEIESLPGKIINNGLLQTLVYLLDSEKPDRKEVGTALLDYLRKCFKPYDQSKASPEAAIALCRENLFEVTDEARQYVHWLKMMAKAEIPKKADDGKKQKNQPAAKDS